MVPPGVAPWEHGAVPILFTSPILTLEGEPVTGRDGTRREFLRLRLPDWVAVVPVRADGSVVLVAQHRFGADREGWEAVGGVVEPGEAPEETARRELLEELGLGCRALEPLGAVWPNPTLQDNRCFLFAATHVAPVAPPRPDPTEVLRPVVLTPAEARAAVERGAIHAALSVLALERALRVG